MPFPPKVSNAVVLLMRLVPLVLEDETWTGFWATTTPRGVLVSMVRFTAGDYYILVLSTHKNPTPQPAH